MQHVPQPKEDVLDAIFQNRNKAYGAYALRKGYDQTLTRSFLYCLAFMAASAIWLNFRSTEKVQLIPSHQKDSTVFILGPDVFLPPNEPEPADPLQNNTTVREQPGSGNNIQITRGTTTFNGIDTTNLGSGGELSGGLPSTPGAGNPGGGTGSGNDSTSGTGSSNQYAPIEYTADMPEFPGGIAAMQRFINDHLQYPLEAKRAGKGGKIVLRFVVGPNGEIDDIEPLSAIQGYGLEEEAQRVLKLMPKWKPGIQNGHPVAVYYVLPIRFELE